MKKKKHNAAINCDWVWKQNRNQLEKKCGFCFCRGCTRTGVHHFAWGGQNIFIFSVFDFEFRSVGGDSFAVAYVVLYLETNLIDSNTVHSIPFHSHSMFSSLSSLQSHVFRFGTGAGGDINNDIPKWQKKLKKGAHKMTTRKWEKKTHTKPNTPSK